MAANSNSNEKRFGPTGEKSLLESSASGAMRRPSGISVLLEFKNRRQAGEPISAKKFLAEPHVPHDSEVIVDIAFAEFLEAEVLGDLGACDRLCEQFPEQAQELRRQVNFHRALTRPLMAAASVSDSVTTSEEATGTDGAADRDGIKSTGRASGTQSEEDKKRKSIGKASGTQAGSDEDKSKDTGKAIGTQEVGDDGESPDVKPLNWLSIPGLNLLKPLGRGGMGVVYLAHEPKLNRKVAVKLLLGGTFASNSHRARFRAEAQAAASLRHPNIVQIDEVGEANGQPYLVMEYVDGGTLEQFLRKQTPTPRESAVFVQTLATAVHQAHLQGIIHRDLKPGNILLARHSRDSVRKSPPDASNTRLSDWLPKITDFGLAKVLGDEQSLSGPALTMAGDMLGTPSYMAPEQAKNDVAGPWTDVYSMGAILYQLLSGRPPFLSATPWETLQQVLDEEPAPLPRSLPIDLRTICLKCIRKQPSARYTSMNMLASDLQRYLDGKPISARRISSWERAAAWCRRNKAITALGTTVFLALLTILGINNYSRTRLAQSLHETELSRKGEAAAHAASMEHLWESLLSEARAQQSTGRIGQRLNALAAVKEAKDLIDKVGRTPQRVAALRDTAAACLPLPDIGQGSLWKGPPLTSGNRVSVDRRFHRVAQIIDDQQVLVTEELGAKRVFEIATPGADHIVISPDGQWLAAWGNDLKLFDLRQSPPKLIFTRMSGGWWGFTPASDKLVGSDNAALIVLDLASRTIEHRLPDVKSSVPLAFSNDNRKIALVQGTSLLIVDIRSGQQVGKLEAPPVLPDSFCLAWHPDNERLAAAKYADGKIALWNTRTGKIVRQYSMQGSFNTIAFDGRGQELIAGSEWGGYLSVFDVESEMELLSLQANVFASISAGPGVATRIWIDSSGGVEQILEFHSQAVVQQFTKQFLSKSLRFVADSSPDGRWLAVSTERGIELYDVRTKGLVAELPIGQLGFNRVCFDSSGRLWAIVAGGWLRWTVAESGVSPPDFLAAAPGFLPIQLNRDGSWMLSSNSWEVKLESLNEPGREIVLGQQGDVRNAAFSHDSRLVATGSWNVADGVKVWNASTGKLEKNLDVGIYCELRFSPDSRWLFTSPRGGEVWSTADWSLVRRLESPASSVTGFAFAFSHDSRWLANSRSNGAIQLWDLDTQEPHALLQDPYQHRAGWLEFSQDQRQLVCVTKDNPAIVKCWDLASLAGELRSMEIDFPDFAQGRSGGNGATSGSPKPSDATTPAAIAPTEFKVGTNEVYSRFAAAQVQSEALAAIEGNDWKRGLELLEENSKTLPKDPDTLNSFAWALLMAPQEHRDPEKSLQAATRAVELDDSRNNLNTLGIAQYRRGQFETAIATLTKSLGDGTAPTAAYDYYPLALCHAKLGHLDNAQDFLSKAIASQTLHAATFTPNNLHELTLLRTEVESLIPTATSFKND